MVIRTKGCRGRIKVTAGRNEGTERFTFGRQRRTRINLDPDEGCNGRRRRRRCCCRRGRRRGLLRFVTFGFVVRSGALVNRWTRGTLIGLLGVLHGQIRTVNAPKIHWFARLLQGHMLNGQWYRQRLQCLVDLRFQFVSGPRDCVPCDNVVRAVGHTSIRRGWWFHCWLQTRSRIPYVQCKQRDKPDSAAAAAVVVEVEVEVILVVLVARVVLVVPP